MEYEFRNGDRVRLLVDHPGSNAILVSGATGTVCHFPARRPNRVGVCWDKFTNGHDCNGGCEDGCGWYVDCGEIEVDTMGDGDIVCDGSIDLYDTLLGEVFEK